MRMCYPVFILLLVLAGLFVPACSAGGSASISSVAATTEGATPPQDAAAFISQAQAAVADRNWTSSMLITTRGLAWYPENPDLLCVQGYTFRKIGQFQKSVDTVSRAIPLDPKAVRFANRGYGYLALGNYSAALADAQTGIGKDANYTANYAVEALALQGMGRNTEALAAIDQALAQDPNSAHYWYVKGRILASGGDCAGAKTAFEKSIAIDPDYNIPYPGFGTAQESLAALDASCGPGKAGASPAPTKAPLGWALVVAALGAVMVMGMRK